ncbi:hypothetical protein J4476_01245 [Candidatus Woesearchaeota archaeon]|nr:MAG: hypothetical protein QT09_C0014G0062 [archaeon GW2011_AR18]MBS3161303.1 hypothetical protein [Candidatus Woesearchaeota archaeon]HIH25747.1 hypothetical protein [Nanoarchaeota archaeon]
MQFRRHTGGNVEFSDKKDDSLGYAAEYDKLVKKRLKKEYENNLIIYAEDLKKWNEKNKLLKIFSFYKKPKKPELVNF